jgi:hypothetical protein
MMKKLLFACLSGLVFTKAIAQDPDYDRVSARIVACYNRAQYDSIWQLFSKGMQQDLSPEKTTEFFSGVMSYYGKVSLAEYDHKNSAMVTYKLTFEQGVMALNFALDKNKNLAGISITPFTPGNLAVLERNSTKMSLPFEGEWTII